MRDGVGPQTMREVYAVDQRIDRYHQLRTGRQGHHRSVVADAEQHIRRRACERSEVARDEVELIHGARPSYAYD